MVRLRGFKRGAPKFFAPLSIKYYNTESNKQNSTIARNNIAHYTLHSKLHEILPEPLLPFSRREQRVSFDYFRNNSNTKMNTFQKLTFRGIYTRNGYNLETTAAHVTIFPNETKIDKIHLHRQSQ